MAFLKLQSPRPKPAPVFANQDGIGGIARSIFHAGRSYQKGSVGRQKILEVGGVLRSCVGDTADHVGVVQNVVANIADGGVSHAAGTVDHEPAPALSLGRGLAGAEEDI